MRQQRTGRGANSVILVNGCPPAPSSQRLHAQAVRDEVESRLSDMLATAEAARDHQHHHINSKAAPSAAAASSSQYHVDAHLEEDGSSSIAGRQQQQQQRTNFLPSIFGGTTSSHHQLRTTAMPSLQGSIVSKNFSSSSSSSSSALHATADQVVFSVQGTPQSVLRDCIKHFLTHPETYGTQVHALLQDELGYILSLWATSPIGAGGNTTAASPTGTTAASSSGASKKSKSGDDDRTIAQNFVEDNFFDRLIREETTRRQQQQNKQKWPATKQSAAGGALDDDETFLAIRTNSPLLPSITPRPPTKGGDATAAAGQLTVSIVDAAPSSRRANGQTAAQAAQADADLALLGNYEVNTLRKQIKSLHQMNAVLSEQLNTKNLEFRDKENELRDAELTIEDLETAVTNAKRGKEALELQLQDLKGSLDDQLLKVTSFRDEEEDKRRTTEARLLEVRSELGQVYAQWKTTQNQLAASQKELDRSVEECEQLHNNLTTAKARLVHAHKVVSRRNRTIVLMQELLLQRRDMHGKLAQCVKELEVFAGSGTLTELYLASDPAWASFLFYRLHRHVFHVSANVSLASTIPASAALSIDTPLFGATSEGGSYRAANFAVELLYRLLISNNGEYLLMKDDKHKPGTSGISATPRARRSVSGNDGDGGGGDSPIGGRARFKMGLGGCKTLQWGESPFQIHFEFQPTMIAPPATQEASGTDNNDFTASLSHLDDTLVSLAASTKFPNFAKQRLAGAEYATKCRPVLTIESLLIPPSYSVLRRLNVPATILTAQHKRALAANDLGAVDMFANLLPPQYDQKFEVIEDTMKLRRSDVRLILYALWKERYQQYMEYFQASRLARTFASSSSEPRSFLSDTAAGAPPPPPQPEPLSSFITFVYRFLAVRFPAAAATSGKKGSAAAAAAAGPYTNPIDMTTVVVRAAVGEDRVAYSYLRSKTPDAGQPGIIDAPLGGKYLSKGGAATFVKSPTVDSVVNLPPGAKEALLALIHYSFEYKEVDADFRLFYLVSHQLLPEAAAINFLAMMESIYRDCDDSVLRHASEGLMNSLGGMTGAKNNNNRAPRRRGPSSTPQDGTGDWVPRLPSLSEHNNSSIAQSHDLASTTTTAAGGPFKELYQELPTTKVEMRTVDSSNRVPITFDELSSSEDDDGSITLDVGNPMLQAATNINMQERSFGDLSATNLTLGGGGLPPTSRQTPKHSLVGAQSKRFAPHNNNSSAVSRNSNNNNSAVVSSNKLQSTVLHRNGLVSLHDFLSIIEKNCFATFQLVKETSSTTLHSDDALDGGLAEDDLDDLHGVNGNSGSMQQAAGTPRGGVMSPRVPSDGEDDDFADLIRTYRDEARMRLEEEASDASPLCRIGFVPLSPIQAQRLKFALSLDQPSSVVKYASLFRPDHGAARPSHFYDELLTMVLDHHLAIQEVIMDELITPACLCRSGVGKYNNNNNSANSTSVDGATNSATHIVGSGGCGGAATASPTCDGEISVQRLLTHAIRWVGSIQPSAPAAAAAPGKSVPPPPAINISPTTVGGSVLARFASQSVSMEEGEGKSATPPKATAAGVSPLEPNNLTKEGSFHSGMVGATPLAIDIAARRFVLQLCEACPPDNTAGQFVDSILTVTSVSRAAHYEATHPQLSAVLDNFHTLPLHHLAAKIRTTLIIFEGELESIGGGGVGGGGRRSSKARHNSQSQSKRESLAVGPKGRGGATVIKSSLAFMPPPREMLTAFRLEMDSACWECERRITLQRALHNDLLFILPASNRDGFAGGGGSSGAAKQMIQAVINHNANNSGGGNDNRKSSRAASTVHRSAISFEEIVDAALVGASPTPRNSSSQPSAAGGGGTMTTTMSFRSFYEDDTAGTAAASSKAATRGKFAAAAAAASSGGGPQQRGRSKSISDAIRLAFDAARFAASDRSLTQLQEQKQIPLEISLSSMLRRQLAPQFPVALLPPVGDLAVYHKALMVALLKPMDDNAAAAMAGGQDGSSVSEGRHFGRRASVMTSDAMMPALPSPNTRPLSSQLQLEGHIGGGDGASGATRSRMRMIATRATSFAFSRDSADPQQQQQLTATTAGVDDSSSPLPTDAAAQSAATGFRRRLGSVAMGMYSSLT